jgi:DNA mismatch repair protein MutS2
MDKKSFETLEYRKILTRLAEHCAFSASVALALSLEPTTDLVEANKLQEETSEAINLLEAKPDFSIGGARDVRPYVNLAEHNSLLEPTQFLDIKYTLIAARSLIRSLERSQELYPRLVDLTQQIPETYGVIDRISASISDRGEILDSASEKLGTIRHDLRITHDRLLNKLQRMVNDPKISTYLQETLVTQRDGRYVLPLRAEFKGRIKSIVHDQSASGATLFVEPLSVVEHNNQFRELQLAERDEERRILAELSRMVSEHGIEINQTVTILANIDFILARANYALQINATQPTLRPIHRISDQHPGTVIRLYQARHPLLDENIVVPIDIELDSKTYVLIITGPNTGGKTVTLKTVGLLALMAQSGLHIPADSGSEISLFENIFADIGDEQSIEQSLSTFSGHITNIIHILKSANSKSLVILDELGAGTDPQEGAALARAILDHLIERRITTLVTTHHPELKAYAHTTPGVVNASVEFDLKTLKPTYHLTIGLPGRSNALAIAERLGIPQDIITGARSELRPEDVQADDLLDEIRHQKELAQKTRIELEKQRHQAEVLRIELAKRLDAIEDERLEIIEEARQESEEQIKELQAEIKIARRKLLHARQPLEIIKEVEEQVEELKDKVQIPIEKQRLEFSSPVNRSIQLGDKVQLKGLNTKGVVTSLTENEAEVQVGIMRVRARLSDLVLPSQSDTSDSTETVSDKSISSTTTPIQPKGSTNSSTIGLEKGYTASPGFELDLRGQRADDALDTLERYLEKAYLAGLPFVRIIHGKGTGRLRDVVRETLNHHIYIKSFNAGEEKEGGEGVTVAILNLD